MKKLWFATGNAGKVASLQRRLGPHGFNINQASLSIPEPRLDSVERTAIFKAMFAYQELKVPVVTNDAGFFVHGLNGFPGTFVNFALGTIEIDGILRLANTTDRNCEFRHALAYDDGLDGPFVFSDVVRGTLSMERRGVYNPGFHWSPLVTIFIPAGRTQTLGEMSPEENDRWADSLGLKPRYYEQFLTWYREHRP